MTENSRCICGGCGLELIPGRDPTVLGTCPACNELEAQRRVREQLDQLIPRDVASKAFHEFWSCKLPPPPAAGIYAMQRAILVAAEKLHMHRHWRGTRGL